MEDTTFALNDLFETPVTLGLFGELIAFVDNEVAGSIPVRSRFCLGTGRRGDFQLGRCR